MDFPTEDSSTGPSTRVKDFRSGDLRVCTARAPDAELPYETVVIHPEYNFGEGVVVQEYRTTPEAEAGHAAWVSALSDSLPTSLTDVGTGKLRKALLGWDGHVTVGRDDGSSPPNPSSPFP